MYLIYIPACIMYGCMHANYEEVREICFINNRAHKRAEHQQGTYQDRTPSHHKTNNNVHKTPHKSKNLYG